MTNLFTYLSNWKLKYICALVVLLYIGIGSAWGAATTIYSETFGDNGNNNTAVASATCYTASKSSFTSGHQTTVVENYSSAGKVGKNNIQVSDNTGASGSSAVWFQAPTGTNTNTLFQIQNIDISGYTSLSLKFNLKRTNGTSSQNAITVKYQIDSNTEQTLSYTVPSDDSWTWCTGDLSGTGSSLRITFSMRTTGGYTTRIDDISLTGTAAASCSNDPSVGAASINGSFFWTSLFVPFSLDNSWLKTYMKHLPYSIGPISYPAPLIYTTYIFRDFEFASFAHF